MRIKIKKLLQNTLLAVAAIALALTVSEICIRLIKPVYDYGDQILLFSSPTFKLYSGGSVRYLPNDKIREVPVFLDKIEYDVRYSTNNLGFIDTKEYNYESVPGKNYYAFVGDSFTVGAGGGAKWIEQLRQNKANTEIYNFGVAGTGFEHFYRLLHDVKSKVNITHILLIAITDDFYRGFWHPIVQDGNICFCYEGEGHSHCQPIPIAAIIPWNASEKEIRQTAKIKFQQKKEMVRRMTATRDLRAQLEAAIYDESALFYSIKLLMDQHRRTHNPSNIEEALVSIRKIKEEFPALKIQMIHLPQKYEVLTKNYSINIADQIAAIGIDYFPALNKCNWTEDMFFTRDAHPNSRGYENIIKCTESYLFPQVLGDASPPATQLSPQPHPKY